MRGRWLGVFGALSVMFAATQPGIASDCVLKTWQLAQNVEDMRPIGNSRVFFMGAQDYVFLFFALDCLSPQEPAEVTIKRDDRVVLRRQLSITPAPNYRYWIPVRAKPGAYEVSLKVGKWLLNEDEFVIRP